jgi:methionyl-tRNA formyltransferase
MEKLRIVFMGTPEFAVGILDTIIKTTTMLLGLQLPTNQQDAEKNKIIQQLKYALSNNLKLLQPTKLKEESFLEELKSLNANLQVVVAFRMLTILKVVWEMPNLGTLTHDKIDRSYNPKLPNCH